MEHAVSEELLGHMAKEDHVLFPCIVALEFIRRTRNAFALPQRAYPTFRGLYYGLTQLETDMHLHVHLENNILFPRALTLSGVAA